MTVIKTSTDSDTLVVGFLDSRLLDSQQIEQIGRELLRVVAEVTKGKLQLDFKGVSFMSSAMTRLVGKSTDSPLL